MQDPIGVGLAIAGAIAGPVLLVVAFERLHAGVRDRRRARQREHLQSKGGYRR